MSLICPQAPGIPKEAYIFDCVSSHQFIVEMGYEML